MRTYSSAEMVMSSTALLRKGVRKFCNQTMKSNIERSPLRYIFSGFSIGKWGGDVKYLRKYV